MDNSNKNPILAAIPHQTTSATQSSTERPIKELYNEFINSANPNYIIQQMLAQNPEINTLLQQANGDPRQAFYNLAQQRGINPNDILGMFK